ncbi:hypothetical protein C9926_03325, partial [Sulfurovum lithotrophicum]
VEDEALTGYYVVRNSFHTPNHFMDGVKIYGGKDTYTYDNFASFDKEKYYTVFAYDDVGLMTSLSFLPSWCIASSTFLESVSNLKY